MDGREIGYHTINVLALSLSMNIDDYLVRHLVLHTLQHWVLCLQERPFRIPKTRHALDFPRATFCEFDKQHTMSAVTTTYLDLEYDPLTLPRKDDRRSTAHRMYRTRSSLCCSRDISSSPPSSLRQGCEVASASTQLSTAQHTSPYLTSPHLTAPHLTHLTSPHPPHLRSKWSSRGPHTISHDRQITQRRRRLIIDGMAGEKDCRELKSGYL